MKLIKKSKKLDNVLYDIRGPIVDRAKEMEAQGQQLIKLNIGNLATFDFQVPEEIQRDMILNLPNSAGYSDSKGIFAARKAVMHYTQELGIRGVTLDDIYLGNGASDLISLATNALLDEGDELLIPMPDYPLWTATTSLSGGTPVHYLCDEENGWQPDLDDIRAKITPRTRGIVIINPNNPTGAVYPKETLLKLVDIAREFGLIIFADEVYDKILYEDAKHIAIASLSTDVLTITFNSLSKAYRACGYRARPRLHQGPQYARQHEALRQRAGPVGDPDRARRLPVDQRPCLRGRPPARSTRPRLGAPHADSGRHLRQAPGLALHVPEARPEDLPDRERPPVLQGAP